jgi:hypothetical protein
MTVIKTSYPKDENMTWEQAAFKSSQEIWNRHTTYKNFSIPPFLNAFESEINNLRNAINYYIKSDLYLQKIECYSKNIKEIRPCDVADDLDEHKYLWCVMASNAIKAIETFFPKQKIQILDILLIVINKQKDYGHNNVAMFGITGLVIRLHDKIARAENLLNNREMKNSVPGESLYDTFLDMIGYSIIAMMWLNNTFMYELGDSK